MMQNDGNSNLFEKFNKFKSECRKKSFAKMISQKRIQNNIHLFKLPKKSLKEHTKILHQFYTSFKKNQNDYSHNQTLCQNLILLWNKLEANEEITDENNSKNLLIILLDYLSLENISELIKISLLDLINLLIIIEKNIIDSLKYNKVDSLNKFEQKKSHFLNMEKNTEDFSNSNKLEIKNNFEMENKNSFLEIEENSENSKYNNLETKNNSNFQNKSQFFKTKKNKLSEYNNIKKTNNFEPEKVNHFFNLTNIINNLLKKEIYFNNCLSIIGNMLLNDENKVPINSMIICLKIIGDYLRKSRNLHVLNNIFWFLRIFFISQEKCDIYELREIVRGYDFLKVFNFLVFNFHFEDHILKMDSIFDTMINFLWCFSFLVNFSKIDVMEQVVRIPTDLYQVVKDKDFDIKFGIIFIQIFNLDEKFFEYFMNNNQNLNEETFVNFLNYLITFNCQSLILEMIIFLDNYFFFFRRAQSRILPLFKKLLVNIFRNSCFSKQVLHDSKLAFINKLISNYKNDYDTLDFLEGLKNQTQLSIFSFK